MDKWSVPQLKAEVERLQLTVVGTGANGRPLRNDYLIALRKNEQTSKEPSGTVRLTIGNYHDAKNKDLSKPRLTGDYELPKQQPQYDHLVDTISALFWPDRPMNEVNEELKKQGYVEDNRGEWYLTSEKL